MATLLTIFPDAEVLLALSIEELAGVVLRLCRENLQNGRIHPQAITAQMDGPLHASGSGYPLTKRDAIELALSEAINWLRVQGLLNSGRGQQRSEWVGATRATGGPDRR
jgi:hypothetical protein